MRLLKIMGGYTLQARNPDSWEGWYWGAKHAWGMESPGQGRQTNLFYDISKNSQMVLFWGCDPETTTWGWGGQMASRFCFWFTELGIRQVYICPDVNYGAAVHADKWIPIRPNTDLAMQFCHRLCVDYRGHYDKEYLATHAVGFDKFRAHVLGEDDGNRQDPAVGVGNHRRAVPDY
jgi:trimethylamine-N-oxide reductase (cytochrome c)